MKRCVECKSEELEEANIEEKCRVGGRTFVASVPAIRCCRCGETYLAHDVMVALHRGAVAELARHGDVDSESFKRICRATGLPLGEVAGLLGITAETMCRWEDGEEPIDRNAAALLSIMVLERFDGHTTAFDRLKAAINPEPWPETIRLAPIVPDAASDLTASLLDTGDSVLCPACDESSRQPKTGEEEDMPERRVAVA